MLLSAYLRYNYVIQINISKKVLLIVRQIDQGQQIDNNLFALTSVFF